MPTRIAQSYFAILEAAVDAIIVSDGQGTILRAIPAAAKMFKYDVAEMVGQSVNMLMPQALAEIHDGFMSHHIEAGGETDHRDRARY
jgi:PAS domain S-box-containing protein